MLNLDELLNLDRLRDKKIERIGNYKELEICKNPDKILKETEEYEYKQVKVLDNYLYDINNKGIIDEIVRMTFYDVDAEYSLFNYDLLTKKETFGFYLRYKPTNANHPWDTLFRACEKAYLQKFEKCNSEKYKEEDHRSQARLLCFELLCGTNKSFNKSFKACFNLDLTNVDDFKTILLDLNLAKHVKSYIIKTVARFAINQSYLGRNEDYVAIRKKINNKECVEYKEHTSIRLDQKFDDSNKDNYDSFDYSIKEGVIEDSNHILDDLIKQDNTNPLEDSFNLYTYIINNLDKILTKKQKEFFYNALNNNLNNYTIDQKCNFKKGIRTSIENFLKNNKNIDNVNNKFLLVRTSLVDVLIDILNSLDNVQRLDKLVYYLKKEDFNANRLTELIYDLDFKYRQDLTALLLNKDINKENYANSKFIHVLNLLNKHLNFILKTEGIFMFNKNINIDEIELKIKRFIDENVLKDKDIAKIPRKCINGYTSMQDLHKFLNNTLNTNIAKNKLREKLNLYGYDISNKPACSIDGYPAYKFFKC